MSWAQNSAPYRILVNSTSIVAFRVSGFLDLHLVQLAKDPQVLWEDLTLVVPNSETPEDLTLVVPNFETPEDLTMVLPNSETLQWVYHSQWSWAVTLPGMRVLS